MITLYSTGCPRCKVIAAKMDKKQINYTVIEDSDEILKISNKTGITSLPILAIDTNNEITFMDFSKAVKWVGEQ